ncbi:MAG: hypothetical protein HY351_05100, partial [Candidatus Omnitrophica bacterium]|nr:hypothetical protein [Candidatus Omnitrophota bacterium]
VFLLIIFITIWNTYWLYRTTQDPFAKGLALGFLGGLFGLLASNMFGSRLDSQEVSSYFWILAALIMRLQILDQREMRLNSKTLKLDQIEEEEKQALKKPLFKSRSQKLDACWNK